MSRSRDSHRLVRVGLPLAAIVMAAGLLTVVLATGSSNAPSADDMKSISALIDEWMDANTVSWPESSVQRETLSATEHSEIDEGVAAAASSVGTAEFAEARGDFSWAGFLQEMRDVDGTLLLKNEHKLLKVEFVRMSELDDAIIRVAVWVGETQARWDADKDGIVLTRQIDTTPVDEYAVRLIDGHWRLANVRHVEMSEDDDPEAYGVNSPHVQLNIDGEWLVGG